MATNRDFKGIWIPREIWLSDDLKMQEKIFLVEISSLDNENGCYANNRYFAEFFGISVTRVSLVINNLIEKGYIKATINVSEGNKRILKTLFKESLEPSQTKVNDPHKQKLKHNNTISNSFNKSTNNVGADKSATHEERAKFFMGKVAAFTNQYPKEMLRAFYNYWTEMNEGGKKLRHETQKIFNIERRLITWNNNDKKRTHGKGSTSKQDHTNSLLAGIAARHGMEANNSSSGS